MSLRKLLLLSSAKMHGHAFLQHAESDICSVLKGSNVKKVLFIPYAQFNFDDYTERFAEVLTPWGFNVEGIHMYQDPVAAVLGAEAILVGGGNSFLLLKRLCEKKLVDPVRKVVLERGVPYIGSSAGTNVSTKNIMTTNDMPIVYPPTYDALNLVPFNINVHFLDARPNDTHQGETRAKRINEFHKINSDPVLGLREGTYLHVEGDTATLKGFFNARLFQQGKEPEEIAPLADFSFLLKNKQDDR